MQAVIIMKEKNEEREKHIILVSLS